MTVYCLTIHVNPFTFDRDTNAVKSQKLIMQEITNNKKTKQKQKKTYMQEITL